MRGYPLDLGVCTTQVSVVVTNYDYLLSTLRPALPTEIPEGMDEDEAAEGLGSSVHSTT